MPGDHPPPRIFGIVASEAPLVAIIRRGPSDWCQVGRWDLTEPRFEAGSWFRGTISPQKCDLSADGRWLAYTAVKYPGRWDGGSVYTAISRLPWLTALAAWNEGTTYTRGVHFVSEAGRNDIGEPDIGGIGPLLRQVGLAPTGVDQFAVERRRGWVESHDTPPREAGGPWDEGRPVEMTKPRPSGGPVLHVQGSYAAHRAMPDWRDPPLYHLDWGDHEEELDAQWADWAADGRLLLATRSGRLQIRTGDGEAQLDHDLTQTTPDPQPPPDEARHW